MTLPEPVEDDTEDLYENAPCGHLSTLPDGRIVRVNRTLLEWTGYRADELLGGRRFQELLAPGSRIYHETHHMPLLLLQGSVREIAVDLVLPGGRRLPVLVNSTVKRDADGAPAVVRTAVFRATDRRGYEQELLRARRTAEESEQRARLLAQILQESLLPPALPAVPGVQVDGVYRPAGRGDEVGGDFYDVFEIGPDDWAVVLGDVCGKGAHAAVVTGVARHTIRAAAVRNPGPRRGLATVNQVLLRHGSGRFCSMVCARLRPHGGRVRLTVASGGHPLPLRITAAGAVTEIGRPGTLLGVVADPTLHNETVSLDRGDVVVFFTDGVPDARRDGAFYGEDRLVATLVGLRHRDARDIADRLGDEVVAFQDGVPRDDIALVVLKVP